MEILKKNIFWGENWPFENILLKTQGLGKVENTIAENALTTNSKNLFVGYVKNNVRDVRGKLQVLWVVVVVVLHFAHG